MDTLRLLTNLYFDELKTNWTAYAKDAIEYVTLTQMTDPEGLNTFAWMFSLFVNDPAQLNVAIGWLTNVIESYVEPTYIDTYATLQYKVGNRKKAVAFAEQALQLAENLGEDITHYQYQLSKFAEK